MLQKLHIKNFTLIDSIDIHFESGFSVITGETGAGKSIILGALSLVLGRRAEGLLLRDATNKCIIEAQFKVSNYPALKQFFKQEDLDYEDICFLRRELLPSGKSRAFVNDTPVTLEVLSLIGAFLIDIHSQHQSLDIFDQQYQLKLIDGLANNSTLLEEYTTVYTAFKETTKQIEILDKKHSEALKESDYNAFLLDELTKAGLTIGLKESLEEKQLQLEHAAEIIEKLNNSIAFIEAEPYGIGNQLQELNVNVSKLSQYGAHFSILKDRLKAVHIELSDISEVLQQALEKQEEDPALLEQLSAQLQTIYNLERKHQAASVADLIIIRDNLNEKAAFVEQGTSEIEAYKAELKLLEAKLSKLGAMLHSNRSGVVASFVSSLVEKLSHLGMPKALFEITINKQESYGPTGLDEVSFLFSANSGQSFGPLKKVASGGELSRIMLGVKALLSKYIALPSIIFDEIDTGISGEVAHKMGVIMKEMGKELQLIAITHLPQVASKGDYHYKVFKEDDGKVTQTQLSLLSKEERIVTLAEMLGGKQLSQSAIAHAKQLLD